MRRRQGLDARRATATVQLTCTSHETTTAYTHTPDGQVAAQGANHLTWEVDALRRMLGIPGEAADVLREQIRHATADGSLLEGRMLELHVDADRAKTASNLEWRVVSVAEGDDVDGVPWDMLLFVSDDGFLSGLEAYRVDGNELKALPPAATIVARAWSSPART